MNNLAKSFFEGMHLFGKKVTHFVNSILLLIVYLFGVGITSIIAKLLGKHFLELKIDKNKDTYWDDTNVSNREIKEYLKQF